MKARRHQPSVLGEDFSRAEMDRKGPDEKDREEKAGPVEDAASPVAERQIGEKILRLKHQAEQEQTAESAQDADAAGKEHTRGLCEKTPESGKHDVTPIENEIGGAP